MNKKSKFNTLIEQLKEDGADNLAAKIVSIRKVIAPHVSDDEYFELIKSTLKESIRDRVN